MTQSIRSKAMYSIAKIALQLSYIIVGMVSSVLPVDKSAKRGMNGIASQIASHWNAVGGYIQSAMDQESRNGNGGLQKQP